MRSQIGIDIGSFITVSAPGEGILSKEPAPLGQWEEKVPSTGPVVKQFYQLSSLKEPVQAEPEKGGDAVPDCTRAVIRSCIERFTGEESSPTVLLSVPCDYADEEEQALAEIALSAGAGRAYLVSAPIAALAGNMVDLGQSAVIVDIGATKTNIAVISNGRLFDKSCSESTGRAFDDAIVSYLLSRYRLRITKEAAVAIKHSIGTVWLEEAEESLEIHGLDAGSGAPRSLRLAAEEMYTALEEPMALLMEDICQTITKIPAECIEDIFETGILLTGGGSRLDGIDRMIAGISGVKTTCMPCAEDAVAEGLAFLLEEREELALSFPEATLDVTRYYMNRDEEFS